MPQGLRGEEMGYTSGDMIPEAEEVLKKTTKALVAREIVYATGRPFSISSMTTALKVAAATEDSEITRVGRDAHFYLKSRETEMTNVEELRKEPIIEYKHRRAQGGDKVHRLLLSAGLSGNSDDGVKAVRNALAMMYHYDRVGPVSNQIMKRINAAYKQLQKVD